jgi:hypothetical protein
MFKKLAKFRLVEPRRTAPLWLEAAHSNDNSPGRRHPAGLRRSRQPVLACHWVFTEESRLECRWKVESFDQMSVEQPDGARAGHVRCVACASLDDAIQQQLLCSLL